MLKKLGVVAHTELFAEFSGEYQFARLTFLALGSGLDLIRIVMLKELADVADAEQLAESSVEYECAQLTFHAFGCGKLVG